MKILIPVLIFSSICCLSFAQPCKTVKPGMTKQEVVAAAGKPKEVYILGTQKNATGKQDTLSAWHYGEQVVNFHGNKVAGNVIVDMETHNNLMEKFRAKEISEAEMKEAEENIFNERCK